jgi:predicted RecA/RadA family phage recombinase
METSTKNLIQPAGPLPWTNTTGETVYVGDVVVYGNILGISLEETAPDNGGNIDVLPGNVYSVPKAAGSSIAGGEKLIYDVSSKVFRASGETPNTGDIIGAAVAASWSPPGETSVNVFLTPGNTTVAD